MKMFKYTIIALACAASLTLYSCSSDFLDAEPTTSITRERLKELASQSPEAFLEVLEPQVTGLYAWLVQYNTLGRTQVLHTDFGHLSVMLTTDLMNEDMVQNTQNYGWFYDDYDFSLRPNYESTYVYLPWNFYYKLIKSANDIIYLFDESVTDERLLPLKGQALAMRAFAYLYLVQLYQHTYVGHETAPAVPIVTEKSTDAEMANNPRATVQEVYDLIIADLKAADDLLQSYTRTSKVAVDKQVVEGLLARAYLNMENGTEAARYARMARDGYTPSITQWNYDLVKNGTGFVNIAEPDWMWGADITNQTNIAKSGIVNPTSHISSISYGYATAGNMQKMIDADLYAKIPLSDIRYKAFAEADITVNGYKVPKYSNLKFGYYKAGVTDNFGDYVFMRASEMYLIEAEALTLSGQYAEAQNLLYDFVITRYPKYVKSTSIGDALRKEIYLQRRIELWGEGFSYFDHKRLKLGITRIYQGSNHRENAKVNHLPESNVFRFRIPRPEITNNGGISEGDNNP